MQLHNMNDNEININNLTKGYIEMGKLNKEIANEDNYNISNYEDFLNSSESDDLQNAYANLGM